MSEDVKIRRRPPMPPKAGLTRPAMETLAFRAGVGVVKRKTRGMIIAVHEAFIASIIHDAAICTEEAKRKTVMARDVKVALKRNNQTFYSE